MIISKFNRIVEGSNSFQFIIFMLTYSVLLFVLFSPIILWLDSLSPHESISDRYSGIELFFLVVVFAPFVETLLFQLLTIEFLKWLLPVNLAYRYRVIVFVSAMIFGIFHLSSYAYAFANFLGGIVLAQTYIYAQKKEISAFACTAVVHSLRNLLVFLLSTLL